MVKQSGKIDNDDSTTDCSKRFKKFIFNIKLSHNGLHYIVILDKICIEIYHLN